MDNSGSPIINGVISAPVYSQGVVFGDEFEADDVTNYGPPISQTQIPTPVTPEIVPTIVTSAPVAVEPVAMPPKTVITRTQQSQVSPHRPPIINPVPQPMNQNIMPGSVVSSPNAPVIVGDPSSANYVSPMPAQDNGVVVVRSGRRNRNSRFVCLFTDDQVNNKCLRITLNFFILLFIGIFIAAIIMFL